MSNFYKMDPAKWDFGTADLSLEEEAAYLRIVNAINKHDAPVPNNPRVLSGMFRCSLRKAKSLLEVLIEAGKVYVEDGKIWNERARSDVFQRQFASVSASESGAKGGRKRAENAAKALKNNNQDQANASSRIEENRIDSKSAGARAKKSTGSRIREDWVLPKDWGDWSLSEGMTESEVRAEAAKFKDYWLSLSGRNATKLDWQATWRNWCRNAIERRPHYHSQQSTAGDQISRWNKIAATS